MSEIPATAHLHITYFTDPLCCWSWGFQPHLDALIALHGNRMRVQYVMGGMLPSWEKFHDEANAVSRPAQMGPVWMHAAQLTGRPIEHLLWIKNPPASSYPACIAVKSAHLQSAEFGITFFKKVQRAAMAEAKDIASWHVLDGLAREFATEERGFDLKQFISDYEHNNAADAFRADLELAERYKINRFPTLAVESPGRKGIVMSGYRTLDGITTALEQAFS